MSVQRIFVEKKPAYNVKVEKLKREIVEFLGIKGVKGIRFLQRYDVEGLSSDLYQEALKMVFSDPMVDQVYEESLDFGDALVFAESYLSGQYDEEADLDRQYLELMDKNLKPLVKIARVYAIEGDLSQTDFDKIKNYIINPVEAEEVGMDKAETLHQSFPQPADVEILDGFINMTPKELADFHKAQGLAMSISDLEYFQNHFISEKRDPSFTELKVVDTYWSDHCRHTTFMTRLSNIEIEEGDHSAPVVAALKSYREARAKVYGETTERPETLMDMATIQVKVLNQDNQIPEVVFSEEINACTIEETIQVDGKDEKWLVLFKNETHNHPTEIEPFGGAGTCLGGAIRDPLSGRSYVYQAMRITGSADPNEAISDTLEGKLPQRVITKTAADGYSAYGNGIGIPAGEIKEYYHPGFKAKRMELGAVVGAVKSDAVIREEPQPGDIVLMIGGRTGRDGCGGATGSSKEQTLDTITQCGSEVQKGSPTEERKIQRLYRNPSFTKRIKRCNDFGAGGVCVAIGELADGININLDKVKLKYPGLDGTEIAISESQERMAIVVAAKDKAMMETLCAEEHVEATHVATITEEKSLVMTWRNTEIVRLTRNFLDSAGVDASREVYIQAPEIKKDKQDLTKTNILTTLASLNVGLQTGLAGQFDATIGGGTVLMPYGGKNQLTKEQGMVAKLPVLHGETDAATYMTHGYDPDVSSLSPFHGALYAVVESVAKLVALGGDYKDAYLSFQEYFERLDEDKVKWGKPAAALLGALTAKQALGLCAIGGKDSMSGTFNELSVPPTLVSFTCMVGSAAQCVSASFKAANHAIVYLPIDKDKDQIPNFMTMKAMYDVVIDKAEKGQIYAAQAIGKGGLVAAIANMTIGNEVGCEVFDPEMLDLPNAFEASYGDLVLEVDFNDVQALVDAGFVHIGETNQQHFVTYCDTNIYIEEMVQTMKRPLANVFPLTSSKKYIEATTVTVPPKMIHGQANTKAAKTKVAKPKVIVPIFTGTNGEYDMSRGFERAGADVEELLFPTVDYLVRKIKTAQIVALADGNYKAMAIMLAKPEVKAAMERHTQEEDGLVIGFGGGFLALMRSGLLPYGTFTDNPMGRHISTVATTVITSNRTPWFAYMKEGDQYSLPVSHSLGHFVASEEVIAELVENGQILSQYIDGHPSHVVGVEALMSKDGRILGKMGHNDRTGANIIKNVPGNQDQKIFEAGVAYYK